MSGILPLLILICCLGVFSLLLQLAARCMDLKGYTAPKPYPGILRFWRECRHAQKTHGDRDLKVYLLAMRVTLWLGALASLLMLV